MINNNNLISLTILTILPALVPTLETRPALANEAAELAPPSDPPLNIGYETQPMSKRRDRVDITSNQKKKPLK